MILAGILPLRSVLLAACLFLGYLLGSVSPSYILGKLLKKIDIRKHGTRNAGTSNAFRVLGLGPAIATAVFDLSKGLLAMFLAHLLGASPLFIHLAGCAAVLGHVFPFYLGFRGGQGVATAIAILLYYLGLFLVKGWFPVLDLVPLAFWVISFGYITRRSEIVAVLVLPVLAAFISIFSSFSQYTIFALTIVAYVLLINILNLCREKEPLPRPPESKKKELNWRLYIRPAAVSLIIFYLLTDEKTALIYIGSLALFFLLSDLVRLFSKRVNVFMFEKVRRVYKPKEYETFSSITLFLFAYFLTILLFERSIAVLATSFLTFGDFFSKYFGIEFARTRLFKKTFEGSLAHLNACVISGYIFLRFVPSPLPAGVFLLGAFVASIVEVLPTGVNDNFSVSLLSASSMSVFLLF